MANLRSHWATVFFYASFATVLGVSNLVFSFADLPNYATWTGVVTIEEKLRLYKLFAQQGQVDLVLFGSSLVDHGISAEVLSRDLSAHYGTTYRVFNFSTGAGDHKTFPLIYRLIRTIAKPKSLLYLHPGSRGTGEQLTPKTPEFIMQQAPVAKDLSSHQFYLSLAYTFRSQPLVTKASAIRDLVIYGKLVNRTSSHMDAYRINDHGDTISYIFSQHGTLSRANLLNGEQFLIEGAKAYALGNEETRWNVFLSSTDRDALRKVRAMAAKDGTTITVMRHDRALGYSSTNAEYLKAVKMNLSLIAKTLGASRVFVPDGFAPRPYEYADELHLNRNGAIRLTHRIGAILTAREPVPEPECAFLKFDKLKDPTINPLTAAIVKPARSGPNLHIRYMRNRQVLPLLPNYPVIISLLAPDGLTIESTAVTQADGSLLVSYPGLPETCEAYIARLQAGAQNERSPYMIPFTDVWWTN